ncbi:hypothetical protein Tco_0227814 [Tanacetum coccineum]
MQVHKKLIKMQVEDVIDAWDSKKEDESAQDYFVLPIWSSYSSTVKKSIEKDAGETPNKHLDLKTNGKLIDKEDQVFLDELERLRRQEKDANDAAEALRKEFAQQTFKIQKVWILIDLPYGKKAIGTKWVYRNKKDERGVVGQKKARQNPVYHSKTKHIAIRHHFIRDAYEKKLIQVLKIHTDDNVADLLTKAFDVSRGLIEFRESLRRVTDGTDALLIPTLFILWLDKVSTDSANLVPLGKVCTAIETLKTNTAKGTNSLRNLSQIHSSLQALISLLTTITLSTTMAVLDSCPKHNMVAYLEKSEGNAEFHEIIDFLKRSSIHHALTVSPVVSTTFVEQFWTSAKSKIINNVRHITAKVAGKSVSISEASIRSDLLFDDADGIDSLPNQAIFNAIQLMGYEGDLTVLTFNKALFLPQWRFLFHTMNHCLSSKSTSWDQIPTNIATGLGYNADPPPYTRNFMPPKSDLVYPSLDDFVDVNESVSESVVENPTVETNEPKNARKENKAPIIKDWASDNDEENVPKVKTVKMFNKPSFANINFVKSTEQVKSPRKTSVDKNRQNTPSPRGNKRNWNQQMSQKLGSNFEMFNKACHVCGSFDHLKNDCNNWPKAVISAVKRNTGNAVKASACWVWRSKHKVLDHGSPQQDLKDKGVIDSECSRHMTGNKSYLTDYEEIDGGFVVFGGNSKGRKITRKVPRKDNMYSVDLKNVIPQGGLTCLFAKATPDESNLWHGRPGHVNFKTMNKLSFLYDQNSQFNQPTITNVAHGFVWPNICKEFNEKDVLRIENPIDLKVKMIKCDNGTEFKNRLGNGYPRKGRKIKQKRTKPSTEWKSVEKPKSNRSQCPRKSKSKVNPESQRSNPKPTPKNT